MENQINSNENQGGLNPQVQPVVDNQGVVNNVEQPVQQVVQQPVQQPVMDNQGMVNQQAVPSQQPVQNQQPVYNQNVVNQHPMQNQQYAQLNYGAPVQNMVSTKTNTLAIVGLILSIFLSFIGGIVSLVALTQIKKTGEKGKGFAIAGVIIGFVPLGLLIIGLFGLLILGVILGGEVFGFMAEIEEGCAHLDSRGNYESEDGYVVCEDFECQYEKDGFSYSLTCNLVDTDDVEADEEDEDGLTISNGKDSDEVDKDQVSGDTDAVTLTLGNTSWLFDDDSEIKFGSVTYNWYRDENVYDDNYYTGTYKYYIGEEAVDFITTDLSSYGVTRDELERIFEASESYNKENFIVLVLSKTGAYINGSYQTSVMDTPYYGFILKDGTYLDIANMNTASYTSLTLK